MIRRTAIGIIGVLILVSACSDGNTTGTPNSIPSNSTASPSDSPSSSASALPFAGAPKVASPLPESVLSGNPCQEALTPQQISEALGIQAAGRPDKLKSLGPFCSWANKETGGQITVTYDIETRVGLSGLYQNVKPRDSTWKELPPILGFPAVASAKDKASCQISVGLADELDIAVTVFLSSSKRGQVDPCEVAPRVAEAVVSTLKKKAGA